MDQYEMEHLSKQQHIENYRGRRLIEGYEEYTDYDEYENYEQQQNEESELNNDYASKCTDRIPVIFKHLCLEWNTKNGFSFSYHSSINDKDYQAQTNWFYKNKNDKISSAKNANIYNTLNGDSWSMSDHKAWNELDFMPDAFKQCRFVHPNGIQECAHYDINKATLTFSVKIPKTMRKRRQNVFPSNIELRNFYDDNNDFEYGDYLGFTLWSRDKLSNDAFDCLNCAK